MSIFTAIIVFILSCAGLAYAGGILVRSISRMADFLGWKEFTVSFIVMSCATALPELFVGISSALRGVPELSFGNIIGQSIIHFTVAVAVCVIVGGAFRVDSVVVRTSAWFSSLMAVLPILLIVDHRLSRIDGVLLIMSFLFYMAWGFSRRHTFSKTFDRKGEYPTSFFGKIRSSMRDITGLIFGIAIILLSAQGIISSTVVFASYLNLPLVIVGAIIVGLGTSLPEMYFSAISAKENKKALMLGNLLGSTAVSVSMVLGVVAIIQPIVIVDLSPYFIGRVCLLASVIFFLIFMSTGRKITIKEGAFLFLIYFVFVLSEVFLN